MPQPGLHALLALAARRTFSKQPWFALGLVLGALLPDADSYPQAFATIFGGMDPVQAEAVYHRTLTHSLFFALALALGLHLVSLIRGGQALRTFGYGLATGIAVLHTLVDVFAWFDGVGILWPIWSIDLWSGLTLPGVVTNVLRAGNFLAFALYFAYLSALALRAGTDQDYMPRLRLYTFVQLGLGVLFTIMAFVLPAASYNIPDGAVFLFIAYPNALWVTWRMRRTIEA